MKTFKIFLFVMCFAHVMGCHHQHDHEHDSENTHSHESVEENDLDNQFDENLAQELGADEYGMAQYVIAFLKSGPNRSQDSVAAAQMQRAHLDNINRLAEEGMIALAGPFLDDTELRGIYVFNVTSVEEAEKLTATDPMIQEGRLIMELHPWYGSAALKKVNEWHPKVAKKEI